MAAHEGEQSRLDRSPGELSAQAESLDDRPVPIDVGAVQVVQQAPTAADQQQQAAPAVVIVLVRLEVFGQVTDAPAQQRNLHLGGAGVAVSGGMVGNDLLLDVVSQWHGRLLCVGAGAVHRFGSRWTYGTH